MCFRGVWGWRTRFLLGVLFAGVVLALPLAGQELVASHLKTGKQIYQAACASCHGVDGAGAPQHKRGFEAPETFPDFTRCDQTTPETNISWQASITNGGPFRGFSPIMPAFGQVLTPQQIAEVANYLRTFCTNPHWPRGELNLPRAIVTEKAFPESEEVITSAINAQGAPGIETHYIHEQRFGVKNQIEVDLPINFFNEDHVWYGGTGDMTLGYKREIYSSLPKGNIFSLFGGLIVPSGSNTIHGLGSGVTSFEMFAAYDQLFKHDFFVQTQLGGELPVDTTKAPQAMFWNTAVGQMFAQKNGLGRMWTPMAEVIMTRDFETGAKTNWDIIPEMQVTLSKRQHVRGSLGVKLPVNNTTNRPVQVMFYLLWDWADGKLTGGW